MLRRVKKYIKDNGLLKTGDRVLVGVSGGADSVCLLDVLLRGGWSCVVCHCNYGLRGEESDRDENFVSVTARASRWRVWQSWTRSGILHKPSKTLWIVCRWR